MKKADVKSIIKETIEELTACDSFLRLSPESILVPKLRMRNNDNIFMRICDKYKIPYSINDLEDKDEERIQREIDKIFKDAANVSENIK